MRPNAAEYCQICGAERRPGDFVCLGCGCTTWGPELPAGVVPEEPTGGNVSGPLEGMWRLPPGRVSLWHGPPGGGKTTLALMTLPGAVVVDLEQDPGIVARLRRREGLPITATVCPVLEEGKIVDLGLGSRRPLELILDSLSAAGDDLAAAELLVAYCARHGARAIAIAHETTAGTAWGGNAIPHLVHSRLRVWREASGRLVAIHKDRSGPMQTVPWRMSVDPPPPARYVSVEGSPGNYELAEHPAKRAEWAGPLEAAELGDLKLPPAPLAVAARASQLYDGGWAEPGDVDERRRFAERQGYRFFRPSERAA